jgi:single-strand DNA-binding protein
MASFNKVILLGNLTRDPEHRVTASGSSICKLGVAVSRNFQTRDGEKREETTFVDVDAFGRQAEVISKYMRKGRPILVEGRLRLDQWESNGEKRSKMVVVLENFQFVGGRDDSPSGGAYEASSPPSRQQSSTSSASSGASPDESADDVLDEDVPF